MSIDNVNLILTIVSSPFTSVLMSFGAFYHFS